MKLNAKSKTTAINTFAVTVLSCIFKWMLNVLARPDRKWSKIINALRIHSLEFGLEKLYLLRMNEDMKPCN